MPRFIPSKTHVSDVLHRHKAASSRKIDGNGLLLKPAQQRIALSKQMPRTESGRAKAPSSARRRTSIGAENDLLRSCLGRAVVVAGKPPRQGLWGYEGLVLGDLLHVFACVANVEATGVYQGAHALRETGWAIDEITRGPQVYRRPYNQPGTQSTPVQRSPHRLR